MTASAELASRIRAHGNQGGLEKYKHEYVGTNSRLDAIAAAHLRHALRKLSDWNAARQSIAMRYDVAFGHHAPAVASGNDHIYHLYEYKCDSVEERKAKEKRLTKYDIAWGRHYPDLVSSNPLFSGGTRYGTREAFLVNDLLISLPMFPTMSDEQVSYVINVINNEIGALK